MRDNEWWWGCRRTSQAASAGDTTGIAAAGQQSRQAQQTPPQDAVDALDLVAPASVAAGGSLYLTARLTRELLPVAGAAVEFAVSQQGRAGESRTGATTDTAGVASVAMDLASLRLQPGSQLQVSAMTSDGRALGARGTLALRSQTLAVPVSVN